MTAGNSYGVMSGGIDLAVRNYFGIWIQDVIQEKLFFEGKKFLSVGDFIIVKTNDITKEYLIYAPTMDIPRKIDKNNIYLVTYNLLDKYYNYNGEGSLAICGLGTNTGGLSHDIVANTMYEAYKSYTLKNK